MLLLCIFALLSNLCNVELEIGHDVTKNDSDVLYLNGNDNAIYK